MKKFYWVAVVAIFLVAGLMRFVNVTISPGYEWDEPVYAIIAQRTVVVGYPNFKGEGNIYNTDVYLYHPPFDFYLKGDWFQLLGTSRDIGSARILSAIEGMITLVIAFFCLKELLGRSTAFIGLTLLATDGWLVYTNRLNLIENGMMLWGLFGIWFYVRATETQKTRYYLFAGLFLGFAAIYKHTGIPFLLVPLVNLAIIRRDWKDHLVIIQVMIIVVLAYVLIMMSLWQKDFIFDSWVQIERSMGVIGARGLNYGLNDVIRAIIQTYWVFFATVAAILSVSLAILYRLSQVVLKGRKPSNSVLLSWSIVTFAFLAAIALKAPHYLITILIPAYMFVASELGNLWNMGGVKRKAVSTVVTLFVLASMFTWGVRFVQHSDNALAETYRFFKNVPATARVIADECIGPILEQPYFNLDRHPGEQGILDVRPDYVVLYSSVTQKPPDNPALSALLAKSQLVRHISGFKETVDIYKISGVTQVSSVK